MMYLKSSGYEPETQNREICIDHLSLLIKFVIVAGHAGIACIWNDRFFLLSAFLNNIFGSVEAIKLTELEVWRLEGDLTEMELLQ